jgi:hypothetical protein
VESKNKQALFEDVDQDKESAGFQSQQDSPREVDAKIKQTSYFGGIFKSVQPEN